MEELTDEDSKDYPESKGKLIIFVKVQHAMSPCL